MARQPVMTRHDFAELRTGTTVEELVNRYGSPMRIHSKGYQTEVYEYIERLALGRQVVEQRRYFFEISQGKVIGKYMKYSNPSPLRSFYSDDPFPNY